MNESKPLITIVTVTYNAEEFLERTIKSVIEQDCKNIEYIIIDGSSSDGTIDIIKKYDKYISYWISEPDDGLYDAMNKGIDIATGEWINFMNAGDSFTNSYVVSNLVKYIDKEIDLIYGNWNNVDTKDNIIENIVSNPLEEMNRGTFCLHQALFATRRILRKYKFDLKYKYAAERDFMFKLYENKVNYKKINLTICDFLLNDEGFSRANKTLDAIDGLSVIVKYTDDKEIIYTNPAYKRLVAEEPINNALFERTRKFLTVINKKINIINSEYKNKTIALYGYGTYGKITKCLLDKSIYIKIFDINYKNLENVLSPKELSLYEFDLLLITVIGEEDKIYKHLVRDGVIESKQKIEGIL